MNGYGFKSFASVDSPSENTKYDGGRIMSKFYRNLNQDRKDKFFSVDINKEDLKTYDDIEFALQTIELAISENIDDYYIKIVFSRLQDAVYELIGESIDNEIFIDSGAKMKKEWIEIIETYSGDWYKISMHQKLSEEFIREFQDKVNWNRISAHQTLSEDFIREFKDKVIWYCISTHQSLSEDFIGEFDDKVDWDCISMYQTLSEDFIREVQDKVDWYYISNYQTLSEDFIKEFQDKVDWDCISINQKLSENFIREFKGKVDWSCISSCQDLSDEFLEEFNHKIKM